MKAADFKPGWRRHIKADDQKPVTLSRAPWEPVLVISGGRTHGPDSDEFKDTMRRFNERT